jgi:hypothetical protein
MLHNVSMHLAIAEQNQVVNRFLQGRKSLISLNTDVTKNQLDLSKYKTKEDRALVVTCLLMLKKIDSLLLELGPLAVKQFLIDLKHELLAPEPGVQLGLGSKRE